MQLLQNLRGRGNNYVSRLVFDRQSLKENLRLAMSSKQHLVRVNVKALVPHTLTMFNMFNRSRERDLARETIDYEYTYRDFDDAGTFVVTSGSSHARSGTPVALHCAHIFNGGEALAGTSMVGIFFLLAHFPFL